jgi:hypothetical protein
VGKPLRNGGSYFLGERRERKLERECCFVNGTLVGSGLETSDCHRRTPNFSPYIDEQVSRYSQRKDAARDIPILNRPRRSTQSCNERT